MTKNGSTKCAAELKYEKIYIHLDTNRTMSNKDGSER